MHFNYIKTRMTRTIRVKLNKSKPNKQTTHIILTVFRSINKNSVNIFKKYLNAGCLMQTYLHFKVEVIV